MFYLLYIYADCAFVFFSKAMLVMWHEAWQYQSVHHFAPYWNSISTNVQWIATELGTDIYVPLRINFNNLIFLLLPSSGQMFNLAIILLD